MDINKTNKTGKFIWIAIFASLFGGFVSAVTIAEIQRKKNADNIHEYAGETKRKSDDYSHFRFTAFTDSGEPNDFSIAAEKTVHSVVHVKVSYKTQRFYQGSPFDFFFGNPDRQQFEYTPRSAGSGVVISSDGYIITNNHVIDGAEEVTVTFNDKTTMTAKVVGADATSDIALIKVDAEGLEALSFADSDQLRLGQWVLAVGNPFNLTSTVTAGIVSAKARSLGIISGNYGIESFIQTDAAVNPGNSGGALVNLKGELVGINTAIASRSGQFEGYSFAVPSNIARKVVEDLMKHGIVQRAFLGISYIDLNDDENRSVEELRKEIKNFDELRKYKGVYVADVIENSAAEDAGIKKGDIITEINGKPIRSTSVVAEEVGKLRPGDKIDITLIQDGKTKQITTVLRNRAGNTDAVKATNYSALGAEFRTVDKELARRLRIEGGAQIASLSDGKLKREGFRQGFIITRIDQTPIKSESDLRKAMSEATGDILIAGIYPNGTRAWAEISVDK